MHPNPQPASNGDDAPRRDDRDATSSQLIRIAFAVTLPRDRNASTLARAKLRVHLDEILPVATLDDLFLAVSELVTNAVLYGTGNIELRIECDAHTIKAEVIDEGSGFEHQMRHDGGLQGVGGKGLFIVAELADSWGVHEGTTHVWFQIPINGAKRQLEQPDLGRPDDAQPPDA